MDERLLTGLWGVILLSMGAVFILLVTGFHSLAGKLAIALGVGMISVFGLFIAGLGVVMLLEAWRGAATERGSE